MGDFGVDVIKEKRCFLKTAVMRKVTYEKIAWPGNKETISVEMIVHNCLKKLHGQASKSNVN